MAKLNEDAINQCTEVYGLEWTNFQPKQNSNNNPKQQIRSKSRINQHRNWKNKRKQRKIILFVITN